MKLKQSGTLAPANEPWTLIRDAIFDLELQEKQKGAKIAMGDWHLPRDGVCSQCLAGSVMSRRLGVDTNDNKFPSTFPEDIAARLYALDHFRNGDIDDAYRKLELECPASLPYSVPIPDYENGPPAFKAAMLKLADLLESAQPKPTARQ